MARIYPLFSSSKGNCTYFGDEDGGVLIDCGVSCKRVCTALENNGIPIDAIRGIFITHTHSDHIAGLRVFLKKCRAPVFAQRRNLDIMYENGTIADILNCYEVDGDGKEVMVGGFRVGSFETPHDTPASCGYRIGFPDGKTAVLCTDLGEVTETVRKALFGADLVLLESNYDAEMLRNGGYPPELKARIRSDHGHLSNECCGEMLKELAAAGTMNFVLGHLSENNNLPEIAERSAVKALEPLAPRKDYMLYIARPEGGGAIVF